MNVWKWYGVDDREGSAKERELNYRINECMSGPFSVTVKPAKLDPKGTQVLNCRISYLAMTVTPCHGSAHGETTTGPDSSKVGLTFTISLPILLN